MNDLKDVLIRLRSWVRGKPLDTCGAVVFLDFDKVVVRVWEKTPFLERRTAEIAQSYRALDTSRVPWVYEIEAMIRRLESL